MNCRISPQSGHYKPTVANLLTNVARLQEMGVNMDATEVRMSTTLLSWSSIGDDDGEHRLVFIVLLTSLFVVIGHIVSSFAPHSNRPALPNQPATLPNPLSNQPEPHSFSLS